MIKILLLTFLIIFAINMPSTQSMGAVPKYGLFEQTFSASKEYTYLSAPNLLVTFAGSSGDARGETVKIHGFWDGGETFKVRFSPPKNGIWTYTTSSDDAKLNGESGKFDCHGRLPVEHASYHGHAIINPAYPYILMYSDGIPYFLMGDTQWAFSIDSISWPGEFKSYVDARSSQGFNYVHGVAYQTWPHQTAKNEGGEAFVNNQVNDLNPRFWQALDKRMAYMNDKGLVVGFMLAWASDGWKNFIRRNQVERYAKYAVNRYGAYNVIWIIEGEYEEFTPPGGHNNLGNTIMKNDPYNHPRTVHTVDTSADDFSQEKWLTLIYQQTPSSKAITRDRVFNKPVVNSEFGYEGDQTAIEVCKDEWEIVMRGGFFIYGNKGTYHHHAVMNSENLNSDGVRYSQYLKTFFQKLEWWKLQPNHSLLAGEGIKLCLADIDHQYVAYIRGSTGSNTLSLGNAANTVYGLTRFDPRTATSETLSDYTGTGPLILNPPSSDEYVFVLTAKNPPNQHPASSRLPGVDRLPENKLSDTDEVRDH